MSEMREKDQADFDLETFVDLFDTAMSSDNPAKSKKTLKPKPKREVSKIFCDFIRFVFQPV